jgi:glutathione S-transferase
MTTSPALTLHYAPFTRSTRPRWMLEELGLNYDLHVVDMKAREHKSPAYLAIHPHGVVPALTIGDDVILESGAIVCTLADLHLDQGLAPAPSSPLRAKYFQWMFYAQATVEPAIVALVGNPPDRPGHDAARYAVDLDKWHVTTGVLSDGLRDREWLLGTFSATDVIVGAMLIWAGSVKLLDDAPTLQAYIARCKARPAYQASRK